MKNKGKQSILIFTDCYIYGGSEKLMAFLLKNEILNRDFKLLYSYRKHREYEIGLKNEGLFDRENNFPLTLLSNNTLFYKINCLKISKYLKGVIKVPFFLLSKFKIYFLWNLVRFILLLRRNKPDIIHVNNGGYPAASSCSVIVLANYLTIKAKVVYQVNNQALDRKSYFEKIYDKFIDRHVNCFINASIRAKQRLVEARNFNPNKIFLVNNCAPLPAIKNNREEILTELNIPLDSFLIVQVAFLSERKGQKYLIDALCNLFRNGLLSTKKVYCAFVGNGEQEDYLRDYINELGLASNVFILGYKNNSEDYIAASDLFLLPSIKDEDMPLVLLSALGYGKPIVATDFAGISQVLNANVNGVLIPNDMLTFVDNLSNEIFRLYSNKDLRTSLGINAKGTYVNYNPESYGLKLKQIYDQLHDS
ncbi:glycosyltransferase [Pedobacter miscanthi]|uniref:glycosyltransferase n=1 Tax=Pedobacter miscanthi TaxID=2259170 RepID=UPI00292D3557|nr:glycosyltransferase [Pedobacter miscanthi]